MTMEIISMNAKMLKTRQAARAGMCEGKLNDTETFKATLVELTSEQYEPPHGKALQMFARHRDVQQSATKEITLSVSEEAADGEYELTPEQTQVRLTYVFNKSGTEAYLYSQASGKVDFKFDSITGVLSGELKDAIVEYREGETPVSLKINVKFEAINRLVKYSTHQHKRVA
ncbi:hypothetical protein N8H71_03215 [Pseudomonas koreensis]|uniref:hypothetical protein n=1 Tax=Pseudomonas koreensis TaxID=198620 RepID=UPI0021C84838|nr:hypothetical protein [Pseudomonas koreensis]MCU0070582.1 hypothetical protein [Pseudomonas koreensis]